MTYPDVEALEAVARGRTEGHQLGTSIGDTDLKIAIRILLFKNNTNGFFDIYQVAAWGGYTSLIVRHTPCTRVRLIPKSRGTLRVVAMREALKES